MILPRIVRMSLKILQRKSVPSFTVTGDGFPGDPVNLVLIGEFDKLRAAFLAAGWTEAQPLNLASSWRMAVAFVLNRPYPAAPFSTLFLFGRGQDVGFQKAIDMSPRKRHHVRFWSLSLERSDEPLNDPDFWLNADRPADFPSLRFGSARGRGTRASPSPNSPSSSPMRPTTTSTPSAISSFPISTESAPSARWRGGAPAKRSSRASTIMSPTVRLPRRTWLEAQRDRLTSARGAAGEPSRFRPGRADRSSRT